MVSGTPTVLLVHGTWHRSWVWDRLRAELSGLPTATVDLPTAGDASRTIADDVAAVQAAVDQLDGPVLVVAHSYGGQVAAETPFGPSVRRILFLASPMPDVGERLDGEESGDLFPDFWSVRGGEMVVLDPRSVLYHDVPDDVAADAIARLVPHSLAAFGATPTTASWRTVPSSYVICEDDHTVPPHFQELVARRASRVHRLPGGHSPMLARPHALAQLIRAELATDASS